MTIGYVEISVVLKKCKSEKGTLKLRKGVIIFDIEGVIQNGQEKDEDNNQNGDKLRDYKRKASDNCKTLGGGGCGWQGK